eukprot:GHVS01095871.1.p1 GENE.GHVS01095871.1~~GHVS01095871.1.p1  ORF type:complete len:508 (-),score=150.17 GHVS01095871.1:340-1863(-)
MKWRPDLAPSCLDAHHCKLPDNRLQGLTRKKNNADNNNSSAGDSGSSGGGDNNGSSGGGDNGSIGGDNGSSSAGDNGSSGGGGDSGSSSAGDNGSSGGGGDSGSGGGGDSGSDGGGDSGNDRSATSATARIQQPPCTSSSSASTSAASTISLYEKLYEYIVSLFYAFFYFGGGEVSEVQTDVRKDKKKDEAFVVSRLLTLFVEYVSCLISLFIRMVRTAVNVCCGCYRVGASILGDFDTHTQFSWDVEKTKVEGVKIGTNFRLVKTPPLSVDCIRAIKRAAGCSVNDVFMCACSGMIRRYCELYGLDGSPPPLPLKAYRVNSLMAFAFPRPACAYLDPDRALANRVALIPTEMAVNEPTTTQRLRRTQEIMGDIKAMYIPHILKAMELVFGVFIPIPTMRKMAGDLFARHSAVIANVPGYQKPVRFAGSLVYEVQVAFCSVLPQVEIVSYAGQASLNVVADTQRFTHLDEIPRLFTQEIQELASSYGITEAVIHPHPYHFEEMLAKE